MKKPTAPDVFEGILGVYSELARLHRMLRLDRNQRRREVEKNVAGLMALVSVVMMNRMIALHPELEGRLAVPPQALETDQGPPDRLVRPDPVAQVLECGQRLRDVLGVCSALESPEQAECELAVVQFLGRLYWTILVPLCAGRPPVESVEFIGREMSAEDLLWLK